MTPDPELLRRFAKTNAEDTFAELVKRHVNLVYSVALRKTNGDEHLAKDVAQMVFTDLARKANSLSRRENLTGWLYTSAHFAASKIVRTENRRRDREEKFMREPINESGTGFQPVSSAPETDWNKIRPALDDAMHELKESDRDAILLRYFENRQFAEVGAKLGLNENAARMRVERALEKLRGIFAKRGITTASALASAISANAIQLAPANLVATLTTASIAATGTGTFTILKIMTATKLKLAFSAIVVASAATAIVVQQQTQNKLRVENGSLTQQIAQLQTDNENYSNRLAEIGDAKKLSDDQFNELLKLRGEVGVLRQQTVEFENARQENRQLHAQLKTSQNQSSQLSTEDQYTLDHSHAIATMGTLVSAMRDYAKNHGGQFPTNFEQLQTSGYLGANNLLGNAKLNDFEFVNAGLVNDGMPDKLILRQKVPYQMPNGKWVREYGLSNGSVTSQYSDDGNFDVFEQQHMVLPANQ